MIDYEELKYNNRWLEGDRKYYTVSINILGENDINYTKVTPKFISSDDTIMSYFYSPALNNLEYYEKLSNYEKFLLKRNTTKGVNAIDIDWNGAVLSDDITIYSTTDLLNIIKNVVINSPKDLWEDNNYSPTQN